ncbi:phosphonate C-P lyase system protein PhnG [Terasakiella sp. A23]|uniref:phosphonate C-P lyase system protein PhnG n=1 Tax=Terasakiella sp. FCG-A23 TaxID=3080561 RepID=UPI0029552390|nr:phosphonate C-P lyase system protein PhnG [Terasakiella sp. A23]MDV7340325.1 phosphonate C-P lyase system protein PhnG [Terasakiella sp. A23]
MSNTQQTNDAALQQRQHWISILARSSAEELQSFWDGLSLTQSYRPLRQPETGLLMVRARAGGVGQRFNLGETTVTRCSVSLESGEIGHSYVTGRDKRHAELAAAFDGLLQNPDWHTRVMEDVVSVIERRLKETRKTREAKVASTKVDFFTMVRGEDA